jgi:hypothetical protein
MKKEPEKEKEYKSREVASLCACTDSAVRKWAVKNGVHFTGEGNRKDYHFTGADIERFRQRPRPGRRWGKENDK